MSQNQPTNECLPTELAALLDRSLTAEESRKKLAAAGDLEQLRTLYQTGTDQLPAMNSVDKWDFYSCRDFAKVDILTQERINQVLQLIRPESLVLDYGCGYCYVLAEAKNRNMRLDYFGVDFSPGFVAKLRRLYPDDRFYTDRADEMLDVQKQGFEYLLLLEVLEHVVPTDLFGFFERMKQFLQPDGIMVVSVPLFEDLRVNTCPCWHCGELGNPNGHVRSYSQPLIKAELELAGFKVIAAREIFYPLTGRAKIKQTIRELIGRPPRQPTNIVIAAQMTEQTTNP